MTNSTHKPFDRRRLASLRNRRRSRTGHRRWGRDKNVAHPAHHGLQMTGSTCRPNMVAQAQARHPDIQVIQGASWCRPRPRGGDPRDPGWGLVTAWYAVVHLAESSGPTISSMTWRRNGLLAWKRTHCLGNGAVAPIRRPRVGHRPRLRAPRRHRDRGGGGGGGWSTSSGIGEAHCQASTQRLAISCWTRPLGLSSPTAFVEVTMFGLAASNCR